MDFSAAYNAACQQNKKSVEDALGNSSLHSIRVYKSHFPQSLTALLASEGNVESVEFLIKQGGKLDDAVLGAASSGYIKYTKVLLSRGASLDSAVEGAARGGHRKLTMELLERGASLSRAVRGAASGNQSSLTNELLEKGGSNHDAVQGAAIGGHIALMNEFLKKGASKNLAVWGSVYAGDYTALISGESMDYAVHAASVKGDPRAVEILLGKGASPDKAIDGAIKAKHVEYTQKSIEKYLDQFSPSIALTLAKALIHNKKMEKLLANTIIAKMGHLNSGDKQVRSLNSNSTFFPPQIKKLAEQKHPGLKTISEKPSSRITLEL